MASELYDKGMKIRREVMGDDYVDRTLAGVDDFNREFQQMVTEHAWGAIWTRPGLSKKQRSLINLSMLAALNRPEEFELHFRGALKNGCTLEELKETLLQIAVYCGMPAGVSAFRIARKVLDERKVNPR
ncbi:MAG TPA: 4-carboxymuconolactone decarboxylase [Candidatus Binataceae bacterium]|nr:4-carboxymuconolactone decarboxylase [Candidatus Binataceae bacterium]